MVKAPISASPASRRDGWQVGQEAGRQANILLWAPVKKPGLNNRICHKTAFKKP
jgi:hypothetical protein